MGAVLDQIGVDFQNYLNKHLVNIYSKQKYRFQVDFIGIGLLVFTQAFGLQNNCIFVGLRELFKETFILKAQQRHVWSANVLLIDQMRERKHYTYGLKISNYEESLF